MLEELNAKEKYSFNKLQKRLRRNVGQAIAADFNMIEEVTRSWSARLAEKGQTNRPCLTSR